jgi:hypothetical protein
VFAGTGFGAYPQLLAGRRRCSSRNCPSACARYCTVGGRELRAGADSRRSGRSRVLRDQVATVKRRNIVQYQLQGHFMRL